MGKRIFVSYSHKQRDWVRHRLCPVLKAGGADVLIDVDRFQAGVAVHKQMDATQDQAEIHLLVLSPHYLGSVLCLHEMDRALATDPSFSNGNVLPVLREACTLPPQIRVPDPLFVNLTDDRKADQWDLVTSKCDVDLGVSAAEWLRVREQVLDAMLDGRSVNLVVKGSPNAKALLAQLQEDLGELAMIDLASGRTEKRRNLITVILHGLGIKREAQEHDLNDLETCIAAASAPVRMVFRHFDSVKWRTDNYREDFFSSLKFLTDERKLVLLVESRAPYATLLPATFSLSLPAMKTVELRGRTP